MIWRASNHWKSRVNFVATGDTGGWHSPINLRHHGGCWRLGANLARVNNVSHVSYYVLSIVTRIIIHMTPISLQTLTQWGRVIHTCIGYLTIIGSDNGLSHNRRQAITWTNGGVLLIGPLGKKLQCNLRQNSYITIQNGDHFVSPSVC